MGSDTSPNVRAGVRGPPWALGCTRGASYTRKKNVRAGVRTPLGVNQMGPYTSQNVWAGVRGPPWDLGYTREGLSHQKKRPGWCKGWALTPAWTFVLV